MKSLIERLLRNSVPDVGDKIYLIKNRKVIEYRVTSVLKKEFTFLSIPLWTFSSYIIVAVRDNYKKSYLSFNLKKELGVRIFLNKEDAIKHLDKEVI